MILLHLFVVDCFITSLDPSSCSVPSVILVYIKCDYHMVLFPFDKSHIID